MNTTLKHLKMRLVSCIFVTVLTTLFLTAQVAQAAALTCGAWSLVKSPNPIGSTGSVFNGVTAISTNDAWAVGSFSKASSRQTLIEHWNGSQWSVVASPNPTGTSDNVLYAVAYVSAKDVWTVGVSCCINSNYHHALIEHWNGTQWKIIPSPKPPLGFTDTFLTAVTAVSASNVWAVGYTCNIPDCAGGSSLVYHTLIEHWDGTSWSVASSTGDYGYFFLTGVTAVSANDIWAVGDSYSNSNGGPFQTLIEHWNGTSWQVVSSPNVGSSDNKLNGVTAVSANNIWAAGNFYNTNSRTYQTLTEHWNGSSWSIVTSRNVAGSVSNILKGVASLSASNVWAIGQYTNASQSTQTLIEHWNGTKWSLVPNAGLSSFLSYFTGVARVAGTGQLWAVGSYNTTKGSTRLTLTEFYC